MTLNKINSECPMCKCKNADVLCLTTQGKEIVVVVKCLEKNHQYILDPKGKNTEWQKFFDADTIKNHIAQNKKRSA